MDSTRGGVGLAIRGMMIWNSIWTRICFIHCAALIGSDVWPPLWCERSQRKSRQWCILSRNSFRLPELVDLYAPRESKRIYGCRGDFGMKLKLWRIGFSEANSALI
jgi:hypothetical protein